MMNIRPEILRNALFSILIINISSLLNFISNHINLMNRGEIFAQHVLYYHGDDT